MENEVGGCCDDPPGCVYKAAKDPKADQECLAVEYIKNHCNVFAK